ncbi:hypothetical protein ACA910_006723 [Epithemia clementina (nom. ined.)]
MGICGDISKTWVAKLQRSGQQQPRFCNSVSAVTAGNSANANTSMDNFSPEAISRTPCSRKARTGVYFENKEVSGRIHPLQASPQDCVQPSSLCKRVCDVPVGKPLSPAPVLAHLHATTKSHERTGRQSHFAPPVKVSRRVKHRILNTKDYSTLSPEEKLFLEAATSLRRAHSPAVNLEQPVDAKKLENPTKYALPPPPFRIAETFLWSRDAA